VQSILITCQERRPRRRTHLIGFRRSHYERSEQRRAGRRGGAACRAGAAVGALRALPQQRGARRGVHDQVARGHGGAGREGRGPCQVTARAWPPAHQLRQQRQPAAVARQPAPERAGGGCRRRRQRGGGPDAGRRRAVAGCRAGRGVDRLWRGGVQCGGCGGGLRVGVGRQRLQVARVAHGDQRACIRRHAGGAVGLRCTASQGHMGCMPLALGGTLTQTQPAQELCTCKHLRSPTLQLSTPLGLRSGESFRLQGVGEQTAEGLPARHEPAPATQARTRALSSHGAGAARGGAPSSMLASAGARAARQAARVGTSAGSANSCSSEAATGAARSCRHTCTRAEPGVSGQVNE